MRSTVPFVVVATLAFWLTSAGLAAAPAPDATKPKPEDSRRQALRQTLVDYYHEMSRPKPFRVLQGESLQAHQKQLKARLLKSTALDPLPARIPLDVHESPPLDHPWCTVRRIAYQLWPNVYSTGLLFQPKQLAEQPAPAMLCPHGHWENGNAHPEVQKRCLNLARLGYITFSSTQNHYEDLYNGVSHQTLMIWNNMRALDYLESLPAVDKSRIGVAGASGGGLQTQMLVALDARVRAATIVGLTCDFREIMFFDHCHCVCNHFPQVMRYTDHPETSTLGLPAALQFLTMNDWTKTFLANNFPTIRQLYAANGASERVECLYFNTGHSYDKAKREATYRWMERWIRGKPQTADVPEPETQTFPVATLVNLKAAVPNDKGFGEIGRFYRQQRGYRASPLTTRDQWQAFRQQMLGVLPDLLGMDVQLPRKAEPRTVATTVEDGLQIERIDYPSEGGIVVPTVVLRKQAATGRLPVIVLCGVEGKDAVMAKTGPGSAKELARAGALVALPDVRFTGELAAAGNTGAPQPRQAWERNGIVWGRPVSGLACTDLRSVVDALVARSDAEPGRVRMVSRGAGDLAIATLFAAAMDSRISSVDVDLAGCSFENRRLPLVPFILQHGDVLQWAAVLADRQLTLRGRPADAGSPQWLTAAFASAGNAGGLTSP
jgi:dienelactone hydrolase